MRTDFISQRDPGDEKEIIYSNKQWKIWECVLMTIFDFKYWFCECHYSAPYGKVISADCERHD